jgi:hypothetical protein
MGSSSAGFMKAILRGGILVAACLAITPPAQAQTDHCGSVCGITPGEALCGTFCQICDPPVPIGMDCPDPRQLTCGEYWGCCPDWQYQGSRLVGEGMHTWFPLCEAHGTYEDDYLDVNGCFGTYTGCHEDTYWVQPWWSECGDWGWGRRSC